VTQSFRYPGRLLVVGGGRMGEAIISGLLAGDVVSADRITIAEPDPARRELLGGSLRVRCVESADVAAPTSDMVLIAVKPQVMDAVVSAMSASISEAIVVSIAAGVTTGRLETLLPEGTPVVRVMPNTPALVGAGMAVVSGGSNADAEQVETVRGMFGEIGEAVVIDERYQDAASAISGSGPAYFALIIDSLARAGVRHGLARDVAERLAVTTMRGTAELIERTGQHPQAVIDAVASPGGTTIAALEAMQREGLPTALAEGVAAAVKRSKELS
jgi:pyrroline-5-carboxylate reductase